MKYYMFRQNNSGGYWIFNEDVSHFVIIQASSSEEAVSKLNEITEDYSEYCTCCGERWNDWHPKPTETPMIYEDSLEKANKEVIVYHADGRKEIFIKR